MKGQRSLANQTLDVLLSKDQADPDAAEMEAPGINDAEEPQLRIHDLRLQAAKDELLSAGAKRVVDLGCGEGRLIKLLLAEKQFEFVLGMDVNYRSLEIAKERLKLDRMTERQLQRIQLIQGSLTYRDKRLQGFDGAALVEVIEHLDEQRLTALEISVFEYAKPEVVVITTPNAEYNVRFADHEAGKMRHNDHRFEWTRPEFEAWANRVAAQFGYTVSFKPFGEVDPKVGALSQMAVFKQQESGL
jgi:3' terminal RNA ribose 2'-O-methyltransferase Hen1